MVSVQSDPDNGFFLTQSGINSSHPSKISERTVITTAIVKLKPKITITDHFGELSDSIVERTKQHELIDVITALRAIALF